MNFITLKELKKMVPVASEFKRVPGLKKILEDGIEVILRKQMENHAEVVVYKNGSSYSFAYIRSSICCNAVSHSLSRFSKTFVYFASKIATRALMES